MYASTADVLIRHCPRIMLAGIALSEMMRRTVRLLTLRAVTKETELTVLRALSDANRIIGELDGATTAPEAERARCNGLLGDAKILSEFAADLESAIARIRVKIGEDVPAPPTAPR